MNWNGYMKSKRYIDPTKKRKAFLILLNIALIFVIIGSLMKLLFEQDWLSVFGIVVPLVIVSRYKNLKQSSGYYEACVVAVSMDEQKIELNYENSNFKVQFYYNALQVIEYSDQLTCLRLVGVENRSRKQTEHLFYLEKEKEQEFLNKFESCSGKEIVYVDRCKK